MGGTMQKVLSSQSRIDKVIADIVFDFNTKPRLNGMKGNAIVVAGSILEACKYYNSFQGTEFKNKCAIYLLQSSYKRHNYRRHRS